MHHHFKLIKPCLSVNSVAVQDVLVLILASYKCYVMVVLCSHVARGNPSILHEGATHNIPPSHGTCTVLCTMLFLDSFISQLTVKFLLVTYKFIDH